jgi:hypothetical protein
MTVRPCCFAVLGALALMACGHGGESDESVTVSSKAFRPTPAAQVFALRRQATTAYQAGDFAACTALLRRAAELRERPSARGTVSQARCMAGGGEAAGAVELLREAVRLGFHDCGVLRGDRDFQRLHAEKQWPDIVAACARNEAEYRKALNLPLEQLYLSDQADRGPGARSLSGGLLDARDEHRRKRVQEILRSGGVRTAADHFHAAMIFQHGFTADHYRQAHELAVRSVQLDPDQPGARWLAAAAKDRELRARGKRQRYGTQFRSDGRGEITFYPVEPGISDAERAEWEVAPLPEAKQRIQQSLARERKAAR